MSTPPPPMLPPSVGRVCSGCKQRILPGHAHTYLFARSGSGITHHRINITYEMERTEFVDFFRPSFFLCPICAKDCERRWRDTSAGHGDKLLATLYRHSAITARFGWPELDFPYYDKLLKGRHFSRLCNLVDDALTDVSVNSEYATLTINWSGGALLLERYLPIVVDDVMDAIGSFHNGFKYQMCIRPGMHSFLTLSLKPSPTLVQVESGKHYFIDLKFHRAGWLASASYIGLICTQVGVPDIATRPEGFRTCPKCAELIRLEASLCRFCKHEFSAEEVASAVQEYQAKMKKAGNVCPRCGSAISQKEAKFCPGCGQKLQAA